MQTETQVLALVSSLLGLLLSISEILAWSKCPWNSISEFLLKRNIGCTSNNQENV